MIVVVELIAVIPDIGATAADRADAGINDGRSRETRVANIGIRVAGGRRCRSGPAGNREAVEDSRAQDGVAVSAVNQAAQIRGVGEGGGMGADQDPVAGARSRRGRGVIGREGVSTLGQHQPFQGCSVSVEEGGGAWRRRLRCRAIAGPLAGDRAFNFKPVCNGLAHNLRRWTRNETEASNGVMKLPWKE